MTTNKSQLFILAWVTYFFLSFYLIRSIFGDRGYFFSISLIISSLVGPGLAYLTVYKKSKTLGITLASTYFFGLIMLLFYLKPKMIELKGLQGQWSTREQDGQNFSLDFTSKENVIIVIPTQKEKTFTYTYDGFHLKTFDDQGNLVFNWKVALDGKKLIAYQGRERLIFYKN